MSKELLGSNNESQDRENRLEYRDLLDQYIKLYREIKDREHKSRGLSDSETQRLIRFTDEERHQIHLKLIGLGSKLGKNKADILIDIINRYGNLEEYGLPEFSIRASEDLEYPEELFENEVLIVFDYTTADWGGELIYSRDHDERITKAKMLAKRIRGRFISLSEGASHDSSETIGVAIPKEDLEKVTVLIRENSEKFRLRRRFY